MTTTIDAFASAATLVRALVDGVIGSEELLDLYLARAERHDGRINAIVVRDDERARAAARAADASRAAGRLWGPLHGLPMTVKESFNLAGTPTTYGLPTFRDNVAESDAVAVTRLKRAGAVIFGKTNVPPHLADAQSANEIYGRTANPWNLERTPGGSSGGSAAALAAGLTGMEMGSDIASSLRNPAHYCGVYAHKSTYGLCSSQGHWLRPRHGSGDISVIGPIGRSAKDLELALRLLADAPLPAPTRLARPEAAMLSGLRIAVLPNDDYAEVDAAVEAKLTEVADFLRSEGADVRLGARPDFDSQRAHIVYELLMRATISGGVPDAEIEGMRVERADPGAPRSDMRDRILHGMTMSHREWLHLDEERHAMRAAWRVFFAEHDLLLCPVLATTAFPHDTRPPAFRTLEVNGREVPFGTQLFWAGYPGASFLPATAAPLGLAADGLPVGMQIIGAEHDDLTCIRFAQAMETRFGGFVAPPGYD